MRSRPMNRIQDLDGELLAAQELAQRQGHVVHELGREAVRPDAWDGRPALGPAVQTIYLAQEVVGIGGIWDADDFPEYRDAQVAHLFPVRIEDRIVEHV